jgi:tRNA dimethylallyltransferase
VTSSRPVLVVAGPTASGKSAVALELAGLVGGEIVSADALQLYDGLPLLTNQPTRAERERVPHHLVGIWPLAASGDVATYAPLAHAAIDDVAARGRVPIVCGGTGLYLRAALAELELPPRPPPGLREQLVAEYEAIGPGAAHARLAALDPPAAAAVHPHDRRRVVRGLELAALGRSLAPAADRLWHGPLRRPARLFGLAVPRALLHERIAARTRAMFAAGVVAEVAAALAREGPSPTAARALGLDELRAVVDGRLDPDAAEQRLVERTRSYARRQEVWLRRVPGLEHLDGTRTAAEIAAEIAARWG